ncbi:hypothetical protein DFH06DRAFT_1146933 [Mycena polygramma]|nr:hypothetical protein DFH06DRAFT_1146933 [Mycena polygramma]
MQIQLKHSAILLAMTIQASGQILTDDTAPGSGGNARSLTGIGKACYNQGYAAGRVPGCDKAQTKRRPEVFDLYVISALLVPDIDSSSSAEIEREIEARDLVCNPNTDLVAAWNNGYNDGFNAAFNSCK